MGGFGAADNLLRGRDRDEDNRVTFVELFFDLVFVFAVTQLSHFLLDNFTAWALAQATLLLLAVWWVWIYTSWVTNWLDPQRTPVRIMLFALMLGGLLLSTSIPDAFGARGWVFAGAYVFMQIGRSLFMLWSLHRHSHSNFLNFQRITVWLLLSSIFWIAGAAAGGFERLALWTIAMAVEYVSPALGFWTPGLGRSTTGDWDVEGGHIAERCGLFIIIALGESVIITGATFARMEWSYMTAAAFLSAFVGTVAMWWVYFNIGAERAGRTIERSKDPGRLARLAYTYIHVLPVAGIIVAAVGDELVLAHPSGEANVKAVAAVLGGPALFLVGNLLFKRATLRRPALSHMIGLGLLALLAPAATWLSPLALSVASSAVLIVVSIWEARSLREPTPQAAG